MSEKFSRGTKNREKKWYWYLIDVLIVVYCINVTIIFGQHLILDHMAVILSNTYSMHVILLCTLYMHIYFLCPWDLLSETLTLLITFEQWALELWYFTLIFLVIRSFRGYPVTLNLEFDPFFENLHLSNNFWRVSARALIFHLSVGTILFFLLPCDLDLGVWLFKTLTLIITIKQWVLELWYFKWTFHETRPSGGYQQFWPYNLDLCNWVSPTF